MPAPYFTDSSGEQFPQATPSTTKASAAPQTLPTGVLEEQRCPECESPLIHQDSEIHCTECGLLLDDAPIDRQLPRERDTGPRKRHSGPGTRPQTTSDLSTQIGWVNSSTFASYSSDQREQIARIRVVDRQSKVGFQTSDLSAYGRRETSRLAVALGLNSHHEDRALHLFNRAYDTNLAIGRTIEGLAGASILATARCDRLPLTLEDIATASTVAKKKISAAFKAVRRNLHIEIPPPHPAVYVPKFCAELELSRAVEQTVQELLDDLDGTPVVVGKSPSAVAAATIYAVGQLPTGVREDVDVTQKDVAAVANTTASVISPRWLEIKAHLE